MIKLEDLIIMSYSSIIVMNGNFEVLVISNNGHLDMSYLSKKLILFFDKYRPKQN